MRCEHCGRDRADAETAGSTHCLYPFFDRRHAFTGRHPSDIREAARRKRP